MRPNVQPEAKALSSPTRHRIFGYLLDADGPVTVAELTSYLGCNHNAVRQHLAILVDAGLVAESVEPKRGRGRPRLLYRPDPEAAGSWETVGPYEYLAGVLATALEDGVTPREAGHAAGRVTPREAGHAAGREAASDLDEDLDRLDAFEEHLYRSGFRPERIDEGDEVDFVLGRCPFEDAAARNPAAVCQAHLGLAEGLAEGLGGCGVSHLVVKDPHRAGCRLALQRR